MGRIYLAWHSITGKKKWFRTFLAVFFIVFTLIFAVYLIGNRLDAYFEGSQSHMEMKVRLQLVGGQVNQEPGENIVPQALAEEIAALPGVENVYYNCSCLAASEDVREYGLEETLAARELFSFQEEDKWNFTVTGMSDASQYRAFQNDEMKLLEGRLPGDSGLEAVVSQSFAELNGLQIGDSFSLLGMGGDTEATELRIVGLHDGSFDIWFSPLYANGANVILTSADAVLSLQEWKAYKEVIYELESAAALEDFLAQAQPLVDREAPAELIMEHLIGSDYEGRTDINHLELMPLKLGYSSIKYTQNNIRYFIRVIEAVLFLFGSIAIGILLADYIRKSSRSIGVLQALGESRSGTLLTYILQLLFPFAIGAIASAAVCFLVGLLLDIAKPGGGAFWEYTSFVFMRPGQMIFAIAVLLLVVCLCCALAFWSTQRTVWKLLKADAEG